MRGQWLQSFGTSFRSSSFPRDFTQKIFRVCILAQSGRIDAASTYLTAAWKPDVGSLSIPKPNRRRNLIKIFASTENQVEASGRPLCLRWASTAAASITTNSLLLHDSVVGTSSSYIKKGADSKLCKRHSGWDQFCRQTRRSRS